MGFLLWRVDVLEKTTDDRHPDEVFDTQIIESGFQRTIDESQNQKYKKKNKNGISNVRRE